MTAGKSPTQQQSLGGPAIYANWIAADAGRPLLDTQEFPLLTDAHITGDVAYGPYEFINTVPVLQIGLPRPAVVLRCAGHVDWPSPDMTKTSDDRYHGGSFQEELAALASLAMGVRFRAGNATRRFERGGDPRGRPIEWWGTRRVAETLIREYHFRWRLPSAAEGSHNLESLEVLNRLPKMPPWVAVSLVRARLYQDALWLIESEPSLAWLLIVSAVETAANQWQSGNAAPVDRMRESNPELYKYLVKLGADVASEVARRIADTLGSAKKFVDFVMRFLPPQPSSRPPADAQFLWEESEIRSALRKVYKYRSSALHDGKPFPEPMCGLPYKLSNDWEAWAEKPLGLAMGSSGGVWLAKDVPMLFSFFEYIARHALLKWWNEGAPEQS
jgi:hypothetical protein